MARWKYDKEKRTAYKHEKESGRLKFVKPDGAWTINKEDVAAFEGVDIFEIRTELATYSCPADVALSKGFLKTLGGEVKLIVPMKNWRRDGT